MRYHRKKELIEIESYTHVLVEELSKKPQSSKETAGSSQLAQMAWQSAAPLLIFWLIFEG